MRAWPFGARGQDDRLLMFHFLSVLREAGHSGAGAFYVTSQRDGGLAVILFEPAALQNLAAGDDQKAVAVGGVAIGRGPGSARCAQGNMRHPHHRGAGEVMPNMQRMWHYSGRCTQHRATASLARVTHAFAGLEFLFTGASSIGRAQVSPMARADIDRMARQLPNGLQRLDNEAGRLAIEQVKDYSRSLATSVGGLPPVKDFKYGRLIMACASSCWRLTGPWTAWRPGRSPTVAGGCSRPGRCPGLE